MEEAADIHLRRGLDLTYSARFMPDELTTQAAVETAESQPPVRDEAPPMATGVIESVPRATKRSRRPRGDEGKLGWFSRFSQRWESRISRLSTRNNFWHRLLAWVFLPLAYRSGIRFREQSPEDFAVVLPFRRFNRNWYNAMAGAALLANSEVAGGMYIFGFVGGDYTVVCKELGYKFLRPCLGPAIYKVDPREDIPMQVDQAGPDGEFNVTVDMSILQAVVHKDEKEKRVGECIATFHVAPKAKLRERKRKMKERRRR